MSVACKAASVTGGSFHILRHTAASHLVMNGVPLNVVAHNLGHADTAMTEKHYAHLAPSYVAETIRKFAPDFARAKTAILFRWGGDKPLRNRHKAKSRLQDAINAYRAAGGDGLDEHAHKVLGRLIDDDHAVDAFVSLLPDGNGWDALLSDCITANERESTHKKLIYSLRKRLKKAPRAKAAVKTIADFLSGTVCLTPEDPIKEALKILHDQIDLKIRLTEETLRDRSRNKTVLAARSEAIGWLRGSILHLTGKPNDAHVATLAQIVCETKGKKDIEIHHVRKALPL
jgi:Phage integrase family